MRYFLFIVLGYFSGSVLYAYLLPKLIKHVDICEVSRDGNPGTANAFMHAGIPVGILVILCELLKGAVPVYMAARQVDITSLLFSLVLIAPVLGHAFPLFFKEKKGGKSIAVSFGVLLGLFPIMTPVLTLAALYIFFSVVIVVRPHFYRSVVTFMLFSACCLLNRDLPVSLILGCFLISGIVIRKHYAAYQGEHFSLKPAWRKRMASDDN